jgi:hypothetical protein
MVLMLLHGMGSFWVYCRLYLIASVHSGLVLGLLYHNTSSSRRVNAFYCQEFGATFFSLVAMRFCMVLRSPMKE